MSTGRTDRSGGGFLIAAVLSSLFGLLFGSGGGLGSAVGFGAAGLVMPVVSTVLLIIVVMTGEPWGIIDDNPLPRPALVAIGIAAIVGSVVFFWRAHRRER